MTPEQEHALQLVIIQTMIENSLKTGFESVTTHALRVIERRYGQLIVENEQIKNAVGEAKELIEAVEWDLSMFQSTTESNVKQLINHLRKSEVKAVEQDKEIQRLRAALVGISEDSEDELTREYATDVLNESETEDIHGER